MAKQRLSVPMREHLPPPELGDRVPYRLSSVDVESLRGAGHQVSAGQVVEATVANVRSADNVDLVLPFSYSLSDAFVARRGRAFVVQAADVGETNGTWKRR